MKRPRVNPRWLMHVAAILPLAWLVRDYLTDNLTVNPIQAAEQRTGQTALLLLGLSLACTPIAAYLGWWRALSFRRPLGLYAFLYAAIHGWLFVGVDFGWQAGLLAREISEKRYLWAGIATFLILLTLAATSWRWSKRWLGKRWKQLHRLVYLAALLAVLHVAWVVKGNALRLAGDVWKPLLAAGVGALLLLLRLPSVRRLLLHQVPSRPSPPLSDSPPLPPASEAPGLAETGRSHPSD